MMTVTPPETSMRPATVIIHTLALALAGALVIAAQARTHWDGISLIACGAAYAICATIVACWISRRAAAAQAAREAVPETSAIAVEPASAAQRSSATDVAA